MKSILIATAFVLGFAVSHAGAVTEIACWGMYAKAGSKPVLKAGIFNRTSLTNVEFNVKDERLGGYFIDKSEDSGPRWGHRPAVTKSEFASPAGDFEAAEITTKRSPYYGNNEYAFDDLGQWSLTAPYIQQNGTYSGRLILPKDLSSAALKAFRIRIPSERSNAVLIYGAAYDSHQSGDNFLRMFCTSK
ncbi:hypothetical protein BH10BDE1_BH10BDE1_01420 [soil metagenome]